MTKELKKNVEEQNAAISVEAQNTPTPEAEQAKVNLVVERKEFTSRDGREMWGYFVRGKVRGREVRIDFQAADQGGYEVLDIIFEIKPTAELVMHDEVMLSEDGTKTPYTVYEVRNVDEFGNEYII